MGKVLIIKGADFSVNAIKSLTPPIEIVRLDGVFTSASGHKITTRADGYCYYFPVESGGKYNIKCIDANIALYSFTEQVPSLDVQFRLSESEEYGSGTAKSITAQIKTELGYNFTAPFNGYIVIGTTERPIEGLIAKKV